MLHIKIENLTYTYPQTSTPAISDICLDIEQGSYVVICGRNGSGKSTLLHQLIQPNPINAKREGKILFNGTSIEKTDDREILTRVGYVPQYPAVPEGHETIGKVLSQNLAIAGYDESTIRSRVAEASSFFGIKEWIGHSVRELSFGQRQLLNLASVIAMNPEVLILDEPVTALDPIACSTFLSFLRNLHDELNVTIIICERNLEDVFSIADNIVVMSAGRVMCEGKPRDVAKELYLDNNQFTYALPSSIRIYHGVHPHNDPDTFPLSVKEARDWMRSECESKGAPIRHLPDKHVGKTGNQPVLKLDDIWFDSHARKNDLCGVSLSLAQGELHAIVGANGSGKSTLLRIAAGIMEPTRGYAQVNDRNRERWVKASAFREGIAYLPQDLSSFFDEGTVREELRRCVEGDNLSMEEIDSVVNEYASNVGVVPYLDANPANLSCGERQLVAIAKVIMKDAAILLLDEPTRGIDPAAQRKIGKLLHELTKRGAAVLMVSQDMKFCAEYAMNVSLLFNGNIATTNTPQAFFSSNLLYTTEASHISRQVYSNAVTDDETIILCLENGWQNA